MAFSQHFLSANTYGFLIKHEVKIAGYWPSSFCMFMERDRVEVRKLAKKKKRTRRMFSHLDDNILEKEHCFLAGHNS